MCVCVCVCVCSICINNWNILRVCSSSSLKCLHLIICEFAHKCNFSQTCVHYNLHVSQCSIYYIMCNFTIFIDHRMKKENRKECWGGKMREKRRGEMRRGEKRRDCTRRVSEWKSEREREKEDQSWGTILLSSF